MEKTAKNILGDTLQSCGEDPLTGFYRDGCCNTGPEDVGSHTVCVSVTEEFLEYSRKVGNDLSTPVPAFDFPGLRAGDRWCLCASRWLQAYEAGCAPRVYVRSTHEAALSIIKMETLTGMAVDLN